jgi:GNAT superfamily N-acetyltransferase
VGDELRFRAAVPEDAPRLAACVVEGFETYREFAPASWRHPTVEEGTADIERGLRRPGAWSVLAESGDELAGHVAVVPAAAARRPVADPRLAHLWQLFVRRPWWGTGLAVRLHAAAVAAVSARGFTAIRLYTPAEQHRARRFYEREGWEIAGAPQLDPDFGLEIVEYRLRLPR